MTKKRRLKTKPKAKAKTNTYGSANSTVA